MVKSSVSYSKLCVVYCAAIGFVFVCALIGCNKSEIPVAPVRGTITVEGKPLAGGRVMFAPQPAGDNINPGKPAYGRLDEQGRYELSTFGNGDGAVIGTHLVTISSPHDSAGRSESSFRNLIVPNTFEVRSTADNEFDITLTADDVKKLGR